MTGKDELPYHLPFAGGENGDADLSHNWGPQHMSLHATAYADGSIIGRTTSGSRLTGPPTEHRRPLHHGLPDPG